MSLWLIIAAGAAGWILTPPVSRAAPCRPHRPLRQWRLPWRRAVRVDAGTLLVEVAARLRAGADAQTAYGESLRRAGLTREQMARQVPECEAALALSAELGAPLAEVVDRVAAGIGDAQAAQGQRRLALVGPVATARLLAALPLFGLVLGGVLGARPLAVLTDGGLGTLSGAAGVVIGCVGVWWMRRLIATARKELL